MSVALFLKNLISEFSFLLIMNLWGNTVWVMQRIEVSQGSSWTFCCGPWEVPGGFKLKLHICIWMDDLAALQCAGPPPTDWGPLSLILYLLSSFCFTLHNALKSCALFMAWDSGNLLCRQVSKQHQVCQTQALQITQESGRTTNWTRRHEVSISPLNQPSERRDTPSWPRHQHLGETWTCR